jgi:hypothetical protein
MIPPIRCFYQASGPEIMKDRYRPAPGLRCSDNISGICVQLGPASFAPTSVTLNANIALACLAKKTPKQGN